jgi:hypothetical protein
MHAQVDGNTDALSSKWNEWSESEAALYLPLDTDSTLEDASRSTVRGMQEGVHAVRLRLVPIRDVPLASGTIAFDDGGAVAGVQKNLVGARDCANNEWPPWSHHSCTDDDLSPE